METFAPLKTMLAELYQYREVLRNILSQDLKVKYKRTSLGYLWSLLNPLLQLAVLSLVFSHIVNRGIKDYTLYLFSGLIAWNFFQTASISSSTSLLENENFIKKIYLPKAIFPLSKLLLRGVDFLFALVGIVLIGLVLRLPFQPTMVLLPLAMLILFTFTLGSSLILSVLTVYFRDVQYLLNVFLQLLYFATPIMYTPDMLPPSYRFVLNLNPILPVLRLFQKLIHAGVWPSLQDWGVASILSLLMLSAGLLVLQAFEQDLVFRM